MKIFQNAKIVTCNDKNKVISNGQLVVDGNRIAAVLSDKDPLPAGAESAETINLNGKAIIPGLVNSHIHFTLRRSYGSVAGSHNDPASLAFRAIRTCLSSLREGVTTARDLGHKDEVHVQLRTALEQGVIPGPRAKVAGNAIVMSYGHAHFFCHQVSTREEIVAEVRRQVNQGVDFIKIIASHDDLWHIQGKDVCRPWFVLEDLKVAADIAHTGGLKITAHANGLETINRVIDAGFDSLEHGIFLDRAAARKMKEQGMVLIPTLSGYRQNANPYWNRGERWTARYKFLWETHQRDILNAFEEGVTIAAGTDTLGGMAEEIELLVQLGLSNQDALLAGTIAGAKLTNFQDQVGSLEVGKLADFVIIDGDPLQRIEDLRNIEITVKGGVEYSQQALSLFIPESPLYTQGS